MPIFYYKVNGLSLARLNFTGRTVIKVSVASSSLILSLIMEFFCSMKSNLVSFPSLFVESGRFGGAIVLSMKLLVVPPG